MTGNAKIALNPLPWALTNMGFELSVPGLRQAPEIATTPFKAIHAHTPAQYRALLAEYGLVPVSGYYSTAWITRNIGAGTFTANQ